MQNNRQRPLKHRLHKLFRLLTIVLAAACMLTLISGIVVNERSESKRRGIITTRQDSLASIVRELEFSGLTDEVKERMAYHSDTYTDYSNFIVIDNQFRVLFSVNQGFLDDSGYFYGIIANDNYTGLVCDKEGNVISQHQLVTDDNYSLGKLSSGFTAYPGTSDAPEASGIAGSVQIIQDGAFSYSYDYGYDEYYRTNRSKMYYAGIPSKNLNVFFMYDDSSPKWTQGYYQESNASRALYMLALCSFLAYWFLLAIWVFTDASQREHHPALWGILTLFTNVVGLIVYLVVRPERPSCKSCGEPLTPGYIICPICGTRNKDQCPSCNHVVDEKWLHCPYCGFGLAASDAQGEPAPERSE